MEEIISLLYPFGLTLLIEYPIAQILWIALKDNNLKTKSKLVFWNNRIIILPVFIVNILTNPAINIFARFLVWNTTLSESVFWGIITIIEFIIWVIEAVLYKFMLKTKWENAFIISIIANITSYTASFLI